MRLILTIEYDGTPFRGWAVQPGLPTVEAALRRALAETFASVENLAVAGRTDSGVHALGQVVSVDVEGGPTPERAAAALNPRLPDEIAVFSSDEAPAGFHARHSARARSYRYRLFTRSTPSPFERRRSWWLPRPLDEDALAAAASALAGEHDFRAFTPAQTYHKAFVRTVERAEWIRRGDHPTSRSRRTATSVTWCAAWWARWSRHRRRSPACSTAVRVRRRAPRLHRGACTSWPCPTK